MTDDFHRRAKEVFGAVIDLPDVERAAELASRCGDDAALRREVEELLAHSAAPAIDVQAAPAAVREALASAALEGTRIPARLGEYRIDALLGEGGMGVV